MNNQTRHISNAAHATRQAAALLQTALNNSTGLAYRHLCDLLTAAAELARRIEQAAEASRSEPPDHKTGTAA